RRSIEHKDHANDYPLVDDEATLVWLAQMAALEIHVPQWHFGPRGAHKNPDRLVLDLDPGPGTGLPECVQVARWCRDILDGMDLELFPVTSGSKGLHLYAPLDGRQTSAQVTEVAHELARALRADHGDLAVSDMSRARREGKVLVDWSQNNGHKTTVAPYSLRGRVHPTVAAPRTWRELASPHLRQLTYAEVLDRVGRRGDPMAALGLGPDGHRVGSSGGGAAGARGDDEPEGDQSSRGQDLSSVRLREYAAKRDPKRTPEPFHEDPVPGGQGRSFVIQEHHARRLHYDFRLEHDDVLVSWALPKGFPPDPEANHLAVQTEDHPLAYGSFEGTIPRGQYGAGTVRIWDAGTYTLEKWRDGKEMIATLHGRPDGGLAHLPPLAPEGAAHDGPDHDGPDHDSPDHDSARATTATGVRFALIHTGFGGGEDGWLIHRMAPLPAVVDPASDPAPDPASDPKPDPDSKHDADSKPGPDPRFDPPGLTPFAQLRPQLATLAGPRDHVEGWAYEMKWDGVRALIDVHGDPKRPVQIMSRNGKDVTAAYPELAVLADQVQVPAVLDGEIVAFDHDGDPVHGAPSFSLLQNRLGLSDADEVAAARRQAPVAIMVFDVLQAAGRDLTGQSYDVRREALATILDAAGPVHVSEIFDGDLDEAMRVSKARRLEGVMAKRRDAHYAVGRRTRTWLKFKHHLDQEVVIVGWRPGQGAPAGGIGSLLLAVPDGASLRYVGRVGTGFTERALGRLRELLTDVADRPAQVTDVPSADARDARWVDPAVVGEVTFAQWTTDRRLRQPVWRGVRPDKSVADVNPDGG
ncbi:MAG: non-homologous end-joining DNA ligase, partial [Cellulomonadaceae bacterium]